MAAQFDSPAGPSFAPETALIRRHGGPVAGIDEAGRGPWAGPVVAAAVILDPDRAPAGLDDSKRLSAPAREALFEQLRTSADVGVGIAAVARIDSDNILQATLWAMGRALEALARPPAAALVDGNRCPELPCPAEALVRGDGKAVSIAAASIIAKVTRDRIMAELAGRCPGYGWERNKGYGTRDHAEAIRQLGVTVHHRRSFRPIRDALTVG